jgi:hypothetical protein
MTDAGGTMTDIPYLAHLREDLVTGIGQRRRRVARRRRAALVLAPAVLAATVVATTLPGGSSPAFAIERDGDWIEIRIADAAASETQMENELQAAGIDADIILAPTTAEYVGQWACIGPPFSFSIAPSTQPGDPPQMPDVRSQLQDQMQATPEVLYLRPGFTGRLVIVIGRAPQAGEQTNAWPEACGLRLVSE